MENEGNWEEGGEGGGWPGKGTGKSMRTRLSKQLFSKLPFVRTHRIGANPEKSEFVKFWAPD